MLRRSDPTSKGTKRVGSPASAEALIAAFSKPVPDPSDPKKVGYYAPVRGMIDFNELSQLTARSNRQGNALKPTLIALYDCDTVVSTVSVTHGEKTAHEPFASASTTAQPRALRDLVSQSDDASGFLNRWVFVGGPAKKKVSVGGAHVDITPTVKPLEGIFGWAASFTGHELMTWSDEALDRFDDFFHSVIEPAKKRSDSKCQP